jgi:molybdate transport system ATP-binding protein
MPEKEEWRREDLLTWSVQRQEMPALEEKGLPDYLKFREQELLFLKED